MTVQIAFSALHARKPEKEAKAQPESRIKPIEAACCETVNA
jgi:hypothetical protein